MTDATSIQKKTVNWLWLRVLEKELNCSLNQLLLTIQKMHYLMRNIEYSKESL